MLLYIWRCNGLFEVGRIEDASLLFGAAEKMVRDENYTLDPVDMAEINQTLQALQQKIIYKAKTGILDHWSTNDIDEIISLAEDKNEK